MAIDQARELARHADAGLALPKSLGGQLIFKCAAYCLHPMFGVGDVRLLDT